MASQPKPVVKDGKFYRVYDYGTPQERWVYVRPASSADSSALAGAPAYANNDAVKAAQAGSPMPAQPAPPPPAPAPTPAAAPPPFDPNLLTAADLDVINTFQQQWATTFANLDRELGDLAARVAHTKEDATRNHVENASGINDDSAARGVFRSSIRDGNHAQNDASLQRTVTRADDEFRRFDDYVKGEKNRYQTEVLPNQQRWQSTRTVENNNDVAAAWQPPPAPEPPQPAPQQAPAQPQQQAAAKPWKPVVKNGKFYHYYPGPPERWVYIRPASGA